MIFSSTFLHAVTFSHVLHLDVVRIETESENLCMAIMQNNPLPSLYTQYYHTYLRYLQPVLRGDAEGSELRILHGS